MLPGGPGFASILTLEGGPFKAGGALRRVEGAETLIPIGLLENPHPSPTAGKDGAPSDLCGLRFCSITLRRVGYPPRSGAPPKYFMTYNGGDGVGTRLLIPTLKTRRRTRTETHTLNAGKPLETEMSDCQSSRLRWFVRLIALLLIACVASAQDLRDCKQRDAFLFVHDSLEAFYPETFGKDRYVSLLTGHPVDSPWSEVYGVKFEIKRFGPGVSFNPTFDAKTGKPIPAPENATFLEGSFWFDETGGIKRVLFDGNDAHSKQNEEIRKLIDSHPEWSEVEALKALKQAGAAYGPTERDHFLQVAQLENLGRILGKHKVQSAEFHTLLNPEHEGNFAELYWQVNVDVQLPNGSAVAYVLSFEPFKGKLVSILRMEPDKGRTR